MLYTSFHETCLMVCCKYFMRKKTVDFTYMDGICMHIQQFSESLDMDCRRMILVPGRTCTEFVSGTPLLLFAITNTVRKIKFQTLWIRFKTIHELYK